MAIRPFQGIGKRQRGRFMARILIVEDDAGLNKGITLTLAKEGYTVDSACCIKEV